MADEIKYFNRLINCIDPAKDAKIATTRGQQLTSARHGAFIVENIIVPLFHPEELQDIDRGKLVGVGDNKSYIEQRINSFFTLNDLPKIQIHRIGFTDTGFDPRTDDMHIAHDAGPGPEKLFSGYTLVLTPASVLDPATRGRRHTAMIDGLSAASSLSPTILNQFALSDAVKAISFNPGRQYEFNIKTSIADVEQMDITFSHAFKEVGSDWCAGNPKKNQFLFDHWEDDEKLGEIQFYFLMKLLGDTLQVAWLKQTISEHALDKSKTAICTNDTDVWLRSIINGVSSVFTKGAVTIFYPVASSDAARRASEVLLRQKYISDLTRRNEDTITNSIELFIGLLNNDRLTFHDRAISPENRVALSIILRSVLVRLRQEVRDTVQRARASLAMSAYKKFIDSHRMQKPFRVNPKGLDITILTSFTSFFPSPGATNTIRFNNRLIHTRLNTGKRIDENDIRIILSGIPVVMSGGGDPQPWVGKGGSVDSFDTIDDISELMRKGEGTPGLLSYIIITYFPEFMFISYAYAMAFNYTETTDFDILFDPTTAERLCAPFKRILNDNTIEYDLERVAPDTTTLDRLMYDMCVLGSIAAQITLGKEILSVFDYAYPALTLFTAKLLESSVPYRDERLAYVRSRLMSTDAHLNAAQTHLDALNLYGELVDAETSLITLTVRHRRSPIAHRLYLKGVWEKHEQLEADKILESRFVPLSEIKLVNSPRGSIRSQSIHRSRGRSRSRSRTRRRSPSGSRRRSPSGSPRGSPRGSPKESHRKRRSGSRTKARSRGRSRSYTRRGGRTTHTAF